MLAFGGLDFGLCFDGSLFEGFLPGLPFDGLLNDCLLEALPLSFVFDGLPTGLLPLWGLPADFPLPCFQSKMLSSSTLISSEGISDNTDTKSLSLETGSKEMNTKANISPSTIIVNTNDRLS